MRHAARRLVKTPAFSLTAILTLGAAIGANALIFSVVNGVLLKPLPFANPERLVGVWHVAPGLTPEPFTQSPATYLTYREEGTTFQDIGLWTTTSVSVTGRGEPEQVEALMVTDGTLPLLGVRPALGRTFTRADDAPGGPDTIVLTHAYWQRVFGADANALGQMLIVNGRPHEVIGVLPPDFRFLRATPTLVLPFRFNRAELFVGNFSYRGVARLKPGVTIEQANADLARLIPTIPDRFPMPPGFTRQMFDEVRLGPNVRPLEIDAVGDGSVRTRARKRAVFFDGDTTTECHRLAPHGARAEQHAAGHPLQVQENGWISGALDSRHRPRGYSNAKCRGKAHCCGRTQPQ